MLPLRDGARKMKNVRNKLLVLIEAALILFGMFILQSCFSEHYEPPEYGPYAYGPVYQQPPVVVNHYVPVPVYRNGHHEEHHEGHHHEEHLPHHDHDRD
jgi:hypothetical protein